MKRVPGAQPPRSWFNPPGPPLFVPEKLETSQRVRELEAYYAGTKKALSLDIEATRPDGSLIIADEAQVLTQEMRDAARARLRAVFDTAGVASPTGRLTTPTMPSSWRSQAKTASFTPAQNYMLQAQAASMAAQAQSLQQRFSVSIPFNLQTLAKKRMPASFGITAWSLDPAPLTKHYGEAQGKGAPSAAFSKFKPRTLSPQALHVLPWWLNIDEANRHALLLWIEQRRVSETVPRLHIWGRQATGKSMLGKALVQLINPDDETKRTVTTAGMLRVLDDSQQSVRRAFTGIVIITQSRERLELVDGIETVAIELPSVPLTPSAVGLATSSRSGGIQLTPAAIAELLDFLLEGGALP